MKIEIDYFIKLFDKKLSSLDESIKDIQLKINDMDKAGVIEGDSLNLDKLLSSKREVFMFFIDNGLPGQNNNVVEKNFQAYARIMNSPFKDFLIKADQSKDIIGTVGYYISTILDTYKSYKNDIEELNKEKENINYLYNILENGFDLSQGVDTNELSASIKKLNMTDAEKTSLSMIMLKVITSQISKEKAEKEKRDLEEFEKRKAETLTRQIATKPVDPKEKKVRKVIDELLDEDETLKQKIEEYSVDINDLKTNIYNEISLNKGIKVSTPEFKEEIKRLLTIYLYIAELNKKQDKYEDILLKDIVLYNFIANQNISLGKIVEKCMTNDTPFDVDSVYGVARDIYIEDLQKSKKDVLTLFNIALGLLEEGPDFISKYGRSDFTETDASFAIASLKNKEYTKEKLESNINIIEELMGYIDAYIDLEYSSEKGTLAYYEVSLFQRLEAAISIIKDLNETVMVNEKDSTTDVLENLADIVDAMVNSTALKKYKEERLKAQEQATYEDLPNPFTRVIFLDGVEQLMDERNLYKGRNQIAKALLQMEKTATTNEMSFKKHDFNEDYGDDAKYLADNNILCLKPNDKVRVYVRYASNEVDGQTIFNYVVVFTEYKDSTGSNNQVNAHDCAAYLSNHKKQFDAYVKLIEKGSVAINRDGSIAETAQQKRNSRKITFEQVLEEQRGMGNRIDAKLNIGLRGGDPYD